MHISQEEAERRLKSSDNLANRFDLSKKDAPVVTFQEPISQASKRAPPVVEHVPVGRPGREAGIPNMSVEQRTEIAFRGRTGEDQKDLAKEFNVSQNAVSYVERGDAVGVNEEQIEKLLEPLRDKALDRLMKTLGLMTDDKLSVCGAKDLASISANVSRVLEKTLPREKQVNAQQINLVIYSPELRKESGFKTIEI